MPEITVGLDTPGMTALHRAGVAGLYMTLQALEARRVAVEGWEGFSATDRSVTVRWRGPAPGFFDRLAKASYGMGKDGLVDFVAIDPARASTASRWVAHEGMFGTFCQFGPNNGLGPARSLSIEVEGGAPLHFEYRPIDASVSRRGKTYPHRDSGGVDLGTAIDKGQTVELASWLYPGAVVRHNAFPTETRLDEDPARALALLFAPVGCFFFKIQSRRQGRKSRFALVVPEIGHLGDYARARLGFTDMRVGEAISSSGGDAALRLLAYLHARDLARDTGLPRVTVLLLGTVVWNEKQKSRTGVMAVQVQGSRTLLRFRHVRAHLKARTGTSKDGRGYVLPSASVELFSDNLALGRRFYDGFGALVVNKEVREWLGADQKGLAQVVADETMFDEEREARFVEACHEALRSCFRGVAERAKSDNVDLRGRFQKEYDRWRLDFSRARSAETFREAITDFWARGGANGKLRAHWREVLPLLGARRWKQGRDLALLALASYSRSEGAPGAGEDGTDEITEEQSA